MGIVATWLNEQRQFTEVEYLLDSTLWELVKREGLLDEYVPLKIHSGRNFVGYITKQIHTMASVVAPGGELPQTRKGKFRKFTSELIKVGLQLTYDEEDMWNLRTALEMAASRGISVQNTIGPNKAVIEGSDNSLATLIYGNLAGLVRSIVEILDYLTWQVLQTGALVWSDPRTGAEINLDWRDPDLMVENGDHFPPELTGPRLWTEYATANGIQDLYDAVDTYVNTNGFPPACCVMSRKLLNHLLQQESTKEAARTTLGSNIIGTIGINELGVILERRGIPKIVLYDEKTETDVTPGVESPAFRFLDKNRFVFLVENMGERAIGPTVENDFKGGIFQRSYEKQKSPPIDVSEVTATILPVFPLITRYGYSRKVAQMA